LRKNEGLIDGLARLHLHGREISAAARRVESSQYPASRAKAKAHAAIESLSQRGAPDVSALLEHDAPLVMPEVDANLSLVGLVAESGNRIVGDARGPVPDAVAMCAGCTSAS